jgi:hypothetical protein
MEAQHMISTAIILFAVAAVGGATMAALHFRGRAAPPVALAALHGLLAASGLVVLLVVVLRSGPEGMPAMALGLFLLAALGGFGLLSFHLRRRRLPSALVLGHGLLAVAGFLLLVLSFLGTWQ